MSGLRSHSSTSDAQKRACSYAHPKATRCSRHDGFLGDYAGKPIAGARQFTLSNWPEARQWIESHSQAITALTGDLEASTGTTPPDWLAIAAWLASTRHPADQVQQRRVLAGHIIGRAIDMPANSEWRVKFRDTRHLLDTVQAILDQRMPLSES
jgi:hypothetical protein